VNIACRGTLLIMTIVLLGVDCDIYTSSFNISQLNSLFPSFSFIVYIYSPRGFHLGISDMHHALSD
jgi:hypothetical protein